MSQDCDTFAMCFFVFGLAKLSVIDFHSLFLICGDLAAPPACAITPIVCAHFFSLSQTYFEHVVMWWLASNQVVFYHPRQLFRRNAILPEVQFLTRNVTGFDKICKLLVLFHPLLQQWYGFTFVLFLGHYRLQFGLVQL